MISRSQDGQLIANLLEKHGLNTMRGSANKKDKVGAKVFIQSLPVLKSVARYLCIDSDGPRGSAYATQPGVVVLSSKSSCPVLPVSVRFSKCFCLLSWDKLQVPLLFLT